MNQRLLKIGFNIFWIAILFGIGISYPEKYGLVFFLFIIGTMQCVTLYHNIKNLINHVESSKNKERKTSYSYSFENDSNYKKKRDDFQKQMDDLLKDLYEQQKRHQTAVRIHNGMSITDAYRLMKLKYTDNPEFIKKRYRELAMQWHPDKFATEAKSKQEAANRNFQKLNTAYNVIKKHKNIA